MKKVNKIVKNGRSSTRIEYDETKYDIRHKWDKESDVDCFILKRLSDGEVLKVFTGKVTNIIQCNKDGKTYFVVTDWNDYDDTRMGKLVCYIDYGWNDLHTDFRQEFVQCTRVSDNSFSLQLHGEGFGIYNLDKLNKNYSRVYDHESERDMLKEMIGEDVLFVREDKEVFFNREVKDTIYYGIDPETFEIKTKIWSELQDRYIKVLSEEEYQERKEVLSRMGIRVNPSSDSLGDKTIATEVDATLYLLARYLEKDNKHTLDTMDVDKEFVKGFKITNKK